MRCKVRACFRIMPTFRRITYNFVSFLLFFFRLFVNLQYKSSSYVK